MLVVVLLAFCGRTELSLIIQFRFRKLGCEVFLLRFKVRESNVF